MQLKKHEDRLAVVIRTFQAGACVAGSNKQWNPVTFEKSVREPLAALIDSAPPSLARVIIVSCGDNDSPLREMVDAEGKTPTMRAVQLAFPEEVARGFIKTVLDPNWGKNAGSASALNVGWRAASDDGDINLVLSWNPDFHLPGHTLSAGLEHMRRYFLPICGFYREGWYQRFQWSIFQNTATIYQMEFLKEHGGFSARCDGNADETVDVGGTSVRLAGMDDFYAYLTAMKHLGAAVPWGMYGVMKVSDWEIEFPDDPLKQKMFDEKVRRQLVVMQAWAKEIFPDVPFWTLIAAIFQMLRQA
jgi:hypothetical protein